MKHYLRHIALFLEIDEVPDQDQMSGAAYWQKFSKALNYCEYDYLEKLIHRLHVAT